jgi:class 3 adenylate cyclase
MTRQLDQTSRKSGRMDFTMEVIRTDDATRTVTVLISPDPRRYDKVSHEGKEWYRDKYLRMLISLDEMAQQMRGLPIYQISPSIELALDYAVERKFALDHELTTGEYSPPRQAAMSHRQLESDPTSRCVAFLSVDICGGTALRKEDAESFDRAHDLFMRELGTLVGQFHGTLLTSTGDGFIACIDHPSFTSLCDATVDLGLSLLIVLRNSLNPALESAGLKPLKIRIGADYGELSIRTISIPPTGFSKQEVASDALNRAVKIQESCMPNEFRIGRDLYELVHVQWLERATETPFVAETVGISGYKTYLMK